ncbi:transposase [uncultured Methanobrevibacter sp.]
MTRLIIPYNKLTYHLVLVVKYRRKVITEPIFESLINYI